MILRTRKVLEWDQNILILYLFYSDIIFQLWRMRKPYKDYYLNMHVVPKI